MIAHSLGALAVGLAVERGLKLERLALIGALAQAATVLPYFSAALGMGPKAAHGMRQQIEKRVGTDFDQLDLSAIGRNLATSAPATLVIHDRHDEEVSWHNGQAIAGAWHGARLITTEGLGHKRSSAIRRLPKACAASCEAKALRPKESRAAAE